MPTRAVRPSISNTVGNHETRIRALERRIAYTSSSGLHYGVNTDGNNLGLRIDVSGIVETNYNGSGGDAVMMLVAKPTRDDGDVVIGFPVDGTAGNYTGSVVFGVGYAGDRAYKFFVDNDDGGSDEVFRIDDAAADVFNHRLDRVGVISRGNTPWASVAGELTVAISSTGTVTVRDSSHNKIFEFRDDGTIHGPTGGSIVWDL